MKLPDECLAVDDLVQSIPNEYPIVVVEDLVKRFPDEYPVWV